MPYAYLRSAHPGQGPVSAQQSGLSLAKAQTQASQGTLRSPRAPRSAVCTLHLCGTHISGSRWKALMSAMPPAMVLVDTRPSTMAPTNSCAPQAGCFETVNQASKLKLWSSCRLAVAILCGSTTACAARQPHSQHPSHADFALTKMAAIRTAWRRVMVLAPTEVPKAARHKTEAGVGSPAMHAAVSPQQQLGLKLQGILMLMSRLSRSSCTAGRGVS